MTTNLVFTSNSPVISSLAFYLLKVKNVQVVLKTYTNTFNGAETKSAEVDDAPAAASSSLTKAHEEEKEAGCCVPKYPTLPSSQSSSSASMMHLNRRLEKLFFLLLTSIMHRERNGYTGQT